MEEILIYLLKMLASSALLFGYYRLALYNGRFHRWNRFYLLATMLLSVMVPLIKLPWVGHESPVVNMVYAMPWNVVSYTAKPAGINWQQVVLLMAGLVSLVLMLRLFVGIYRLARIYRNSPVNSLGGSVKLVLTSLQQAPFSFFNWLFWRQDIDPASANGQRMLEHELTHIHQHHSSDKLYTEILLALFWMNPFFWLIRRELNMIHEFLADQKAIGDNDGAAFAGMILQAMHVQPANPLVNPFFSSQLKRRLLMITTSKKPQYSYLRRIIGLVIMIASAIALTLTVQQANAQTKDTKPPVKAEKKPAQPGATYKTKSDGKAVALPGDKEWQQAANGAYQVKSDSSTPLYILEGKEISALVMKAIKPDAINSVSVLKGKQATDRYGDKGKHGVVIIDLKNEVPVKVHRDMDPITVIAYGKQPMYIIDGSKVADDEFKKLKPDDIESINVLKDKSATEKYGEAGKNGVIEITTKSVPYSGAKVFEKAEKMPEFPGGQESWRRYLERALNYPEAAQEAGIQGVAKVSFIVDENGNISDFKIVENPGKGLGEEALRIIRFGPKWSPAEQNGRKVAARVTQTVTFRLE